MDVVSRLPEPDRSVIDTLESVLADAREGKVSAVAVAYVLRDGKAGQTWSTAPLAAMLLGAIHRLAFRYNERGMG